MIRVLDKNIADKIAAGEVIDRPVSIIKELIENSLDADASAITVEIKNGGKSYIRITDNGCDIEADQAELAFRRHATSKITCERDLDSIKTLGFRGEALASISAVSRVELITKTADSKAGRRVVIEGGEILENSSIGCPDGTTVTVRDLFYNVPARRKFLASDNSEARRILDVVSRISLAYSDVKMTMINNGRIVFATQGKGNILNNILAVYGSDMGRDLLPVDASGNGFVLKGFISAPSNSAPSRSRQIFCINGRIVVSKVMEQALEDGYKEKLFQGRFPIAFLFLSMPPEKLDVNVHPAKKEIRFDDSFEIHDFIKNAVRQALNVKEALPQIREKNIDHVAEEISPYTEQIKSDPAAKAVTSNAEKSEQTEQVDIINLLSGMRREKQLEKEEYAIAPAEPETRYFDFDDLDYMGAVFNTYITAADADSFYLIDQHAAHERIFYEKLLDEYNREEKLSQQLLIPITVPVSAVVASTEDSWLRELTGLGYSMEFFGNNTYIVREIPAFMDMSEAEDFLLDFFREIEDKPDLTNKRTLERIIMRSCKSAVKGGDFLTDQEIQALIKDLSGCVNPFSCPHGRPTFIRMTKKEIEKLFKRV